MPPACITAISGSGWRQCVHILENMLGLGWRAVELLEDLSQQCFTLLGEHELAELDGGVEPTILNDGVREHLCAEMDAASRIVVERRRGRKPCLQTIEEAAALLQLVGVFDIQGLLVDRQPLAQGANRSRTWSATEMSWDVSRASPITIAATGGRVICAVRRRRPAYSWALMAPSRRATSARSSSVDSGVSIGMRSMRLCRGPARSDGIWAFMRWRRSERSWAESGMLSPRSDLRSLQDPARYLRDGRAHADLA